MSTEKPNSSENEAPTLSSAEEQEKEVPTVVESDDSPKDLKEPAETSSSEGASNDKVESVQLEEAQEEELIVETVKLNQYTVGKRVRDFPLSTPVITSLNEMGLDLMSRYQQAQLDHYLSGEDWWVSANLASNRGLMIGSYLVDCALANVDKVTAIMCVAVPKIRQYFQSDLLNLAKYTDVTILRLDKPLSSEAKLSANPNIIIASVEALENLGEYLDLTSLEVVYFDEIEKSFRDNFDLVTQMLTSWTEPQKIIQSSFYSKDLVAKVRHSSTLIPTRLYRTHPSKTCDIQYSSKTGSEMIQGLLATYFLNRFIFIVPKEDSTELFGVLQSLGVDLALVNIGMDAKDLQKVFDSLRENRLQVVIADLETIASLSSFETDYLVFTDSEDGVSESDVSPYFKQCRKLVLLNCSDETLIERSSGSIDELLESVPDKGNSMIALMRRESGINFDLGWTSIAERVLAEPDGKQLLGQALRVFLQQSRSNEGYLHSQVYRLETRDVYQRRGKPRKRKRT